MFEKSFSNAKDIKKINQKYVVLNEKNILLNFF